jgi:phospholipid/cholesterol/gamma-HCH transport system ATP-binding protein
MSATETNGAAPHPIELREVVKTFGRERVLGGVDLVVPANAITVLLGPSGAGKTVTIKHALGLIRPTSGFVLVRGHNLALAGEDELNEVRRSMAAVLQGTLPFSCGLFFSLSVFENVAFPLRERTRWPEDRIESVARENLELVGLGEAAELMPDQLSSGMAKRVAIARALALSSEIVIVDDFDSGLDGVRLALLCELLRDAQRRTGSAYLVSTHDMAAARRLADRIAVIHDGRVVASGTADEVLTTDQPVARQLVAGAASGPIKLRGD